MPNYNFSVEDTNSRLLREAWVQGLRGTAVVYRKIAATEENFKQKVLLLEKANEHEAMADKFTEWKE